MQQSLLHLPHHHRCYFRCGAEIWCNGDDSETFALDPSIVPGRFYCKNHETLFCAAMARNINSVCAVELELTMDTIRLAGDSMNMTPEKYMDIIERLKHADYEGAARSIDPDILEIFVYKPPKNIHEMTAEECIQHKCLLEKLIIFLRMDLSFTIQHVRELESDATEEERSLMLEYHKTYGPKAKEEHAEREKKGKARDKLIESMMSEKGWNYAKAAKIVDSMGLGDDDEEDE